MSVLLWSWNSVKSLICARRETWDDLIKQFFPKSPPSLRCIDTYSNPARWSWVRIDRAPVDDHSVSSREYGGYTHYFIHAIISLCNPNKLAYRCYPRSRSQRHPAARASKIGCIGITSERRYPYARRRAESWKGRSELSSSLRDGLWQRPGVD